MHNYHTSRFFAAKKNTAHITLNSIVLVTFFNFVDKTPIYIKIVQFHKNFKNAVFLLFFCSFLFILLEFKTSFETHISIPLLEVLINDTIHLLN